VTTAGAALDAIAVLRAVGLVCDLAVCVVDREEGGAQALAAEGVTLAALLRLSEIRAA
jgi:orotate phosphoribosyltransferase